MKRTMLFFALIVLCLPMIYAVQPTQQYNKLFLTPFYVPSMTQNIDYNYVVPVNTPDGISEVKSAIIVLDAWINPTRTVSVWVNGVACNTPSYQVTTTYASAGRAVFTFDCANALIPNQNNSVRFRVSGGNIGASTAWLELTYMNDPVGEVKLHGTEYVPGDLGKMFLQYLDSENNPVSISECFLTLWYPDNTIVPGMNNTLMAKLNNASDGIYYKNFNVPNVTGVYPASAKCYKPLTFYNEILYDYSFDGFETNTWTGGNGWADCPDGDPECLEGWDYENTVPLSTIQTNAVAGCYAGSFCAKYTGSYGWIERGLVLPDGTYAINISFAFKFKGFQNLEHGTFFIFDGNWHKIDNFGQHAQYGGYINNQWYVYNFYATQDDFELGAILIGFFAEDMPSTSDEIYIDNVKIDAIAPNISLSNETAYQILRGSGEVHVSNLYNLLSGQLVSLNQTVIINNDNLSQQLELARQNITSSIEQSTNYISSQIYNMNASLSYDIEAAKIYISGKIDAANDSIITTLFSVNSSLSNDIEDAKIFVAGELYAVNTSLSNNIDQSTLEIIGELYSVNSSLSTDIEQSKIYISGQLSDVNDSLSLSIENSKIYVVGELYAVNGSINNAIDASTLFLDGRLTQVNESVVNEIINTKQNLTAQISDVPDKVWSWEGAISDNILTRFATKIWNYVARYIHGEELN